MTATTNERRTNYLHHEPVLPRWKGALAAASSSLKGQADELMRAVSTFERSER
mgnify:CR=1 FL=1